VTASRGVPSAPIIQHLRQLMAQSGAGPAQIAAASGVSERTVRYVLNAPPDRRVYRPTANKLISVRRLPISAAGSIPGHGALRRVEALACLGWTRVEIARRAGLSFATLGTVNLRTCAPRTLIKIASIYSQIREQIPAETHITARTRVKARRAGFVPPWAWPGASIDDPNAEPSYVHIDNLAWRRACQVRNIEVTSEKP
jgi:hypothetical protein